MSVLSTSNVISRYKAVSLNMAEIDVLILLTVLLGSFLFPAMKPFIYLALIGMVFLGPLAIVKALTLSWLAAFVNPLMGDSGGVSILRIGLLFAAFISIAFYQLYNKNKAPPPIIKTLWLFGIVLIVLSCLTAYALDVSLLKIMVWLVGASALIWCMASVTNRRLLHGWFYRLIATVTLASLCMVFSEAGYLKNGVNFQGILSHPQVLGAFAGIIAAYLLVKIVSAYPQEGGIGGIHPKRSLGFDLFILAGCLALLFLSGARTGLVAFVFGMTGGVIFSPAGGRRTMALYTLFCIVILGFASIAFIPQIGSGIMGFLMKDQGMESFSEAFHHSRGFLILQSWANFLDHPFMGIGFGLPSDESQLIVKQDPLFGLPIGASIEKGFFFSGMLEEIGLIGSFSFLGLMGHLFWMSLQSKDASRIALFWAALATNIGDATLFSLGGNGLFIWVVIAYGAVAPYGGEKPMAGKQNYRSV